MGTRTTSVLNGCQLLRQPWEFAGNAVDLVPIIHRSHELMLMGE